MLSPRDNLLDWQCPRSGLCVQAVVAHWSSSAGSAACSAVVRSISGSCGARGLGRFVVVWDGGSSHSAPSVRHRRARRPRRRPAHVQLAQRRDLVERDLRPRGTSRAAPGTWPRPRAWSRSPGTATGTSRCPAGAAARLSSAACSRTLTMGAWMWSTATVGTSRGYERRSGQPGELLRPDAQQHLGQGGRELRFQRHRPGVAAACSANRPWNNAATCLYARYCISRAKSRSRASSRARSSSSSTSPLGSSRAAFRSSRVAATSRNSVAVPSSQAGARAPG